MLGGISMMIAATVRYHKEKNVEDMPSNIVPKTAKKNSAMSPHKLPAISTIQGALPNID